MSGTDSTISEPNDQASISLLEVLLYLSKHRKVLIGVPVLAAILALGVTMLLPSEYTAVLKIAPSKNAPTYNWVLNNERLIGAIGKELDLAERYGTTTKRATERAIRSNVKVTLNAKDGYLDVAATDTNPEFAARLANAFGTALSHNIFEMRLLDSSKARYALELRRELAAANLAKMEKNLARKEIQDVVAQISPMDLYAMGSLGGIQADVALQSAQTSSGTDTSDLEQSQLIRVQDQLSGMQRILVDGVKAKHGEAAVWIATLTGLQDRAYWTAMIERLDRRIELMRKQERDELKITWAVEPDETSGPRRGLIVLLAALSGLLAALSYVFVANTIHASRGREAGVWRQIAQAWRSKPV